MPFPYCLVGTFITASEIHISAVTTWLILSRILLVYYFDISLQCRNFKQMIDSHVSIDLAGLSHEHIYIWSSDSQITQICTGSVIRGQPS